MSKICFTLCLSAAMALVPAPMASAAIQITSVTLCRDVVEPDLVPIDITEEFHTKTPELHAIVVLADVKESAVVEGAWVSVNAIATPNYRIDALELDVAPGPAKAHFSISKPDNDWPPGDYRLEVSIDGQLATIKTFKVVPATGAAPAPAGQAPPGGAGQRPGGSMAPQTQGGGQPAPQTGSPGAPAGFGYSGTYVMDAGGNRITLVLDEDRNGMLTGTLSSTTGTQFQIEGQAEEGAAAGVCHSDGAGVFFEAYVDGGDLWFSLIEPDANNMPDYDRAQDLTFTKVGGGAPSQPAPQAPRGGAGVPGTQAGSTAQSGPGVGTGPAQSGRSAGASGVPARGLEAANRDGRPGNIWRHPFGFSFWFPQGWTAQEHADFLQLIPPNAGSSPDGPTEIYAVVGETVAGEGISRPDDPRVVSYMDQEIRSISPFVTRQGGTTPINWSQGQGAIIDWEGTSQRGDVIHARAFMAIIKDHGVALIAIGFKNLLDARDADLRQMFSSFGIGQGQNDPALVGTWKMASTAAIDNQSPFESAWSRAQAVSETETILAISPDGTCTWTSKSQMIVGAGDVWLEDNSSTTNRGTWNAGSGILYIIWEDNTYRECAYQFQGGGGGRQMKLACQGKGEIWEQQ